MSDALRANCPDRGNYSDMSAALRANGPDRDNYSDMSEKWPQYRASAAGFGGRRGGGRFGGVEAGRGQPRISST